MWPWIIQETFSSERGGTAVLDLPEEALQRMRLWMINQDSPHHTRLRKLVNAGFTPNMIKRMTAHIRELATEVIDGVARKGECDFVGQIASELQVDHREYTALKAEFKDYLAVLKKP